MTEATDKVSIEKVLARNEEFLTRALGCSNIGLWDWTIGNAYIYFSASYYIFLGYAPFERPAVGPEFIDHILPEDRDKTKQQIDQVLTCKAGSLELEFRVRKKSGRTLGLIFRGQTVERDTKGRPARMVGTVMEKQGLEAALVESRRQLAALMDNLPGMAYKCIRNENWQMSFVSQGCINLTGYTPEELTGNSNLYRNLIHVEDRLHVWEAVETAIAARRPYAIYYKIKTAGGQSRWVWEQGRGVYDVQGGFLAIEGFTADVTAFKTAEQNLQYENRQLKNMIRTGRRQLGNIIGKSRPMQKVYSEIIQAAESRANVAIYGESGTGKELVAQAIHEMSDRRHKNFVAVNCGAIPDNLMESEFFGCKKGAFTGAAADKPGHLDLADGGTLFLDEIGEINLSTQVKLLRAIDGGGYTALGGSTLKRPDIRIITATNRDLKKLVNQGAMRQDFFYRIRVLLIRLPALRHRTGDISLLAAHFLDKFSTGDGPTEIPEPSLEALKAYDWPGNVRELQNLIQRYVTLGRIDFLPPFSQTGEGMNSLPPPASTSFIPSSRDLKQAMDEFQKLHIINTLSHHGGNRTHTAKALGIGIRTLQRKLKTYNIH